MSKFIPVEYLGSAKEIEKICLSTIETLVREYKIKISQEQIIPAIVNSFIDAVLYEGVQFNKNDVRTELNLFNLLRVINESAVDQDDVVTTITLGRMGMRKLEMEFENGMEECDEQIETNIADLDIKLLEKISMRASDYIEDRHKLMIRDYQIIFKVSEVFFNELIGFIRLNEMEDDTLTVFDQFTVVLDELGKFESIEITESAKEIIQIMFNDRMDELNKLDLEDEVSVKDKEDK